MIEPTATRVPEAANNLLKILRVVLNFAVCEGVLAANPALAVKRYKKRGDGIHTWAEAEVSQFEAHYPIGSKARLALELMLSTGQRRGDIVKMGRQHIEGDCIAVRQEKTDEPLLIPIDAALATVLPRTNMTFLLTEFGKPFTAAGFGNWFRDRCNEAGCASWRRRGSPMRAAAASRSKRSPDIDRTRRSRPTSVRPTRPGWRGRRKSWLVWPSRQWRVVGERERMPSLALRRRGQEDVKQPGPARARVRTRREVSLPLRSR
jgi:hypothetical protein